MKAGGYTLPPQSPAQVFVCDGLCFCVLSHSDHSGHGPERGGEALQSVSGWSHWSQPEGRREDLLWRASDHRKLQVTAKTKKCEIQNV